MFISLVTKNGGLIYKQPINVDGNKFVTKRGKLIIVGCKILNADGRILQEEYFEEPEILYKDKQIIICLPIEITPVLDTKVKVKQAIDGWIDKL